MRECQQAFGFSNGAWHAAVARGDISPRGDRRRRRTAERRREVARLLASGLAQSAVAAELGITPATVSYHARRLGRAPHSAFARRYDWAAIQLAYDGGLTVRGCQAAFGFNLASWSAAVSRGAVVARPKAVVIDELLVAGRVRNRVHVKRRLLAASLKSQRCKACGISDWRAQPLTLALHHVNGDGADNRFENLQLLCPNCHSQTPNFAGRNTAGGAP